MTSGDISTLVEHVLLVSRYAYDDLGRKVAEIATDSTSNVDTDNPVDYTSYDLAGNVDSVRRRRNDHVLITDTRQPRC